VTSHAQTARAPTATSAQPAQSGSATPLPALKVETAPQKPKPAKAAPKQVSKPAPKAEPVQQASEPLPAQAASGGVAPGGNPYAHPDAPYKVDKSSSTKLTEPLLDTPRTVTTISKEVLEDKQATSIRELARTTPGVTLGTGEGGNAFGDVLFIRGLPPPARGKDCIQPERQGQRIRFRPTMRTVVRRTPHPGS
jgi:catecholate siderophore receptor